MSITPRCTGMLMWGVFLLVLAACSSKGSTLVPVPASPEESSQAMQAPTVAPSTPANSPPCGDPLSNPPSASFGSQSGSTATVRTYTPTINIARTDYEAALAKWTDQQIYEYEIDVNQVSLIGFRAMLHVTGDQVEVLTKGRDGQPLYSVEYAEHFTVAALFDQVDTILAQGLCPATGIWAFPVAYTVTFDPDKGYPTFIRRSAHEPPEWREEGRYSSAPAHSSYSITLQNLKVIKTGVPGMPHSGQSSR